MERYIAIDNVAAWPNLTLLPNGEILALLFNKPSHGRCEGEVEAWVSGDGGRIWSRRSAPVAHDPKSNRMNVAGGLNHRNEMVVIVSGWTDLPKEGVSWATATSKLLDTAVAISKDDGKTWTRQDNLSLSPRGSKIIPFGDVVKGPGETIYVTGYAWIDSSKRDKGTETYLFESRDHGATWQVISTLESEFTTNETALLRTADGRLHAAARCIFGPGQSGLTYYVSEDEGRSWRRDKILSRNRHFPAHLLEFGNKILLFHGTRSPNNLGVDVMVSEDQGANWAETLRVVDLVEPADVGYPTSVVNGEGKVVLAYYSSRCPHHQRYHMGVLIFSDEELKACRFPRG